MFAFAMDRTRGESTKQNLLGPVGNYTVVHGFGSSFNGKALRRDVDELLSEFMPAHLAV